MRTPRRDRRRFDARGHHGGIPRRIDARHDLPCPQRSRRPSAVRRSRSPVDQRLNRQSRFAHLLRRASAASLAALLQPGPRRVRSFSSLRRNRARLARRHARRRSRVRYVSAAGVEIAVTVDRGPRDVRRNWRPRRPRRDPRADCRRSCDRRRLPPQGYLLGRRRRYAVRDVANTGDGFARVSLVRLGGQRVTRSNYRREQIRPQSQRR